MLQEVLFFAICSLILVKSSSYALRAILRLARALHLSEFIISFLIAGFVSSFPEMFVALIAALEGFPDIGIGTLLGSNVADLTLVIGVVALVGGKIHLQSQTMRYDAFYLILVTLATLLALDGMVSRADGVLLVCVALVFIINLLKDKVRFHRAVFKMSHRAFLRDVLRAVISILILAVSAHFTVYFATRIASGYAVAPLVVSTLLIALGTCLPELTFALRAIWHRHHDGLAIGDILGNVIIDGTLLIGVVAIIRPVVISFGYALLNLVFLPIALMLVLTSI